MTTANRHRPAWHVQDEIPGRQPYRALMLDMDHAGCRLRLKGTRKTYAFTWQGIFWLMHRWHITAQQTRRQVEQRRSKRRKT